VFERFTEEARQVVVEAQAAARSLHHGYIGTEHELLGLLAVPETVASRTLVEFGVTAERVRTRVAEVRGLGDAPPTGQIPFTPQAKKTLELGLREALSLGHQFVAPGHLLLGLIAQSDDSATELLAELGAEPEAIRERLVALLAAEPRVVRVGPERGTTRRSRAQPNEAVFSAAPDADLRAGG
jgi:ATP-dependent Clp protease ATP-binding subunit ClpC